MKSGDDEKNASLCLKKHQSVLCRRPAALTAAELSLCLADPLREGGGVSRPKLCWTPHRSCVLEEVRWPPTAQAPAAIHDEPEGLARCSLGGHTSVRPPPAPSISPRDEPCKLVGLDHVLVLQERSLSGEMCTSLIMSGRGRSQAAVRWLQLLLRVSLHWTSPLGPGESLRLARYVDALGLALPDEHGLEAKLLLRLEPTSLRTAPPCSWALASVSR